MVSTRPVDWSRYQELLKLRDFDAITMGWGMNAPESDPRQIWHSESTKEGGDNFVQWKSVEADRLIEKGRRTMDEAERMLVWRELEAVIADEQPYTFVRISPWLRFVKREFGNVQTYRTGLEPQEFFKSSATPTPAAN
jgi:peptide/nickel transport system substrate-binding protein